MVITAMTRVQMRNSILAFSMKNSPLSVALVVPHIFMHQDILPQVIFSPGHLALALADGLAEQGVSVTLFTPGMVTTKAKNVTADLSLFERELAGRDDTYMDLLRKHPFTFITLARQVQSELVAKAYQLANEGKFDVVHIYTNEEEIALPFASLCKKPVVFTHHDPFNFLVKYKNNFPKYKHLNWLSMSYAQRDGMPDDTNWVGNIYHGLDEPVLAPLDNPSRDYVAFLGRIINPKGVHLAIGAILKYNETAEQPLKLKIAGKHYAEESKDTYWREKIEPRLGENIEYVGFIDTLEAEREFLGNAKALLVPSLFDEPFGMVTLEAFACGTPVVALDSGALPEVIDDGVTGYLVEKSDDETKMVAGITKALQNIAKINPTACRSAYETSFTLKKMVSEHKRLYLGLSDAKR